MFAKFLSSVLTPRTAVAGSLMLGSGALVSNFAFSTASSDSQSPLDPKAFKAFTVHSVHDVSHDTKIFRFELPAGQSLNLPIASAIVTKAPIGPDGKDVFRPYTPISSNLETGYFDLLIKGYPQGVMSKYFMSLKAGDKVDIKGPIPKISVTPNMKKQIAMVAGGTGITPMLQVLNAIVENPNDKTEVTLLFANKSVDDILLKTKLDDITAKHTNIKVHYLVDKAPTGGAPLGFSIGYVTPDLLSKHLPAPSDDVMVFVCGPPGMMQAVSGPKAKDFTQGELSGMLAQMGWKKEQVYKF